MAKECLACQQSKIQTHIRAPVSKITVPTHIHIDLVGPLPRSEGDSYLQTTNDRTKRWPDAIPINNTSTSECAKTLIRHWISRFGVPLDMTSDRGPQFTSVPWNDIADKLGISIHRTCAYHPESNRLVGLFNRSLKAALKAHLHRSNWVDELIWFLLGLRTVPKEDLETLSAELVYGQPLTLPGELINSDTNRVPVTNIPFKQFFRRLHPRLIMEPLHHTSRPP